MPKLRGRSNLFLFFSFLFGGFEILKRGKEIWDRVDFSIN